MEASSASDRHFANVECPSRCRRESLVINRHLQTTGRRKVHSHTYSLGLVRALHERFPQMNDGFAEANGVPSRIRRTEINLGLAIDMEKKAARARCWVPNVKNASAMDFAQFLKLMTTSSSEPGKTSFKFRLFQNTTVSLTIREP